jgi:hypothetical protein
METTGLLFIPDISGFSRFVSEMEIEHSRLIIQELLESLINSNELGLEISEIEGDAILFYKFGEPPQLEELYRQVEKMFCEFHKNLIAYDLAKFCQCAACTSMINLSLKVITHFGEFTNYNVKEYKKLIGKDVIVVHRLLKNDIDQHEYWLVTKSLLYEKTPDSYKEWMIWNTGHKQTESGEVPFHYTELSKLKEKVSREPLQPLDLSKKVKVISVSTEYDSDIITLFRTTGDCDHWSKWKDGVKAVEKVSHYLPRVGMKFRSILEKGEIHTYVSSFFFSEARIEFSETDEDDKFSIYYTLDKRNDHKTTFTLDYYIKKNAIGEALFKLMTKNKMEKSFQKSLVNLHDLLKNMQVQN